MNVDKIKIISKGKGIYSSNLSAINLGSNDKKMSPKEVFESLTFCKKASNENNKTK